MLKQFQVGTVSTNSCGDWDCELDDFFLSKPINIQYAYQSTIITLNVWNGGNTT
jgi:hypothetical protein